MKEHCTVKDLERMYYWHALPDNWEAMPYHEFLVERRERIAAVIRDAYKLLSIGTELQATATTIPLAEMVAGGETTNLEFKSTLRVNLHTGKSDPRIEMSALKTIAGFLNTRGGTLIIGCNDSGEPQGLEADQFANEDKMYLHLVNLVNERIGPQHMMYIHPRFEDMQEGRVLVVECWSARSPACLKDNNIERFFIRTGASTTELSLSQMQDFVKQRFLSH
jgi:predicted HTH transcriptional regulator